MYAPHVVSETEWAEAIQEFRAEEKRTTRERDALAAMWSFLDLTPLGRHELWEDAPAGVEQDEPFLWWRRHDEYESVVAP
jgi:predicted dithiol-disulfide oxidoreductase (DUF899 family)